MVPTSKVKTAIDEAVARERARCAGIADECATIVSINPGEIYIAKKIAALIRQASSIPVRSQ